MNWLVYWKYMQEWWVHFVCLSKALRVSSIRKLLKYFFIFILTGRCTPPWFLDNQHLKWVPSIYIGSYINLNYIKILFIHVIGRNKLAVVQVIILQHFYLNILLENFYTTFQTECFVLISCLDKTLWKIMEYWKITIGSAIFEKKKKIFLIISHGYWDVDV